MKTFSTYIAAKSRAIRSMDKCDWVHAVSVIVYVIAVIITVVESTK